MAKSGTENDRDRAARLALELADERNKTEGLAKRAEELQKKVEQLELDAALSKGTISDAKKDLDRRTIERDEARGALERFVAAIVKAIREPAFTNVSKLLLIAALGAATLAGFLFTRPNARQLADALARKTVRAAGAVS